MTHHYVLEIAHVLHWQYLCKRGWVCSFHAMLWNCCPDNTERIWKEHAAIKNIYVNVHIKHVASQSKQQISSGICLHIAMGRSSPTIKWDGMKAKTYAKKPPVDLWIFSAFVEDEFRSLKNQRWPQLSLNVGAWRDCAIYREKLYGKWMMKIRF